MKPKFLFTLGGDLGNLSISEPEGWKDIQLNIERDPTYWSLIENLEVSLIFYGQAGSVNGGYDYVKLARDTGINTVVTLLIQVSFNRGQTYDTCFNGLLDLSTAKEIVFRNKIEVAVLRNDIWSTFINKKSTPVDIKSANDIYGNPRVAITTRNLSLITQQIEQLYQATNDWPNTTISYSVPGSGYYGIIDFDVVTFEEIEDTFHYSAGDTNSVEPFEKFSLKYGGSYAFDIKLYTSVGGVLSSRTDPNLDVIIRFGAGAPITLTKANIGTDGLDGMTRHTYSATQTLTAGDEVRIYFYSNTGGAYSWDWTALSPDASHLNVTAQTIFDTTTCQGVLIHDAGMSICDRIIGQDYSFYSEFFGGAGTAIAYGANGCGYLNALTRGLNIKTYSLTDKPFTFNYDDWWNGANPIFNLGCGYETVSGSIVIRIEQKSHFFDDSSTSATFIDVNNIEIEWDISIFIKTLQIGFDIWQAESASGIDDPQTKHIYNTIFSTFGSDDKQLSKFIAASLAIEQGRRLSIKPTTDWRMDENIFIIALGTLTDPEVGLTATNLKNYSTRYNIRHTPARMLYRWLNFYSGQLQDYLSHPFKFSSGEGNILMTWTGDGSCDNVGLAENADILPSSDYLFLPLILKFTHVCTWEQYKAMRDNRNLAIEVSWIATNGDINYEVCFIKKLTYEINKSKANFEVWPKTKAGGAFDAKEFDLSFDI